MAVGGAGAAAALRSGHMANKRTLEQARKEARARLLDVQQKEAERERLAVEDAAAVVRARTRREDVDGRETPQSVCAQSVRTRHTQSARTQALLPEDLVRSVSVLAFSVKACPTILARRPPCSSLSWV